MSVDNGWNKVPLPAMAVEIVLRLRRFRGFIENNSQQLGTVFALQMINLSPVQAGTVFAYRFKSL